MQWICYIGGRGRNGYISVQIALSKDPHKYLAELKPTQPHEMVLMAYEPGDEDLLEERRGLFKTGFRNGWYKASEDLLSYIEKIPEYDMGKTALKKVCVDWTPAEVLEIEQGAERIGTTMKTKVIRRAVKFYLALTKYKARGWTIQAVKDGKLRNDFADLDDIKDPDE